MHSKLKLFLFILLIISFSMMSCIPKMTKFEAFPNMYKELPVTILVLPPVNETTAAEATDYYTTTIAEPLANAGFYVFSIEVINQALQDQGLYEIDNYENIPLIKFLDYFGADAVLFTKIKKWDTSYFVVGGSVTVSIDFKLLSTKTTEVLWKYSGSITVDTSGDSGNAGGLAGLLVLAVTTAVNTAATDYVPQAKSANIQALQSIPYGKYHHHYNKDRDSKVVETKKVNDKTKSDQQSKETE